MPKSKSVCANECEGVIRELGKSFKIVNICEILCFSLKHVIQFFIILRVVILTEIDQNLLQTAYMIELLHASS